MSETSSSRGDDPIPEAFKMAQRNRISYVDMRGFLKRSPVNVFVYGSLQLPREIALSINKSKIFHDDEDIGFAMRMTPATLLGHRVYAVRDCIFPAILDDGTEDDVVEGMVMFGLDEGERQCLDRREGGWYSREERRVYIRMESGEEQVIRAHVYIWAHGTEHLIDRDEKIWSLEEYASARKKAPGARPSEEKDPAAYEKSIDEMQKRYALRDEQRKRDLAAEKQRREKQQLADYEENRRQKAAAHLARQKRMKEETEAIEQKREKERQKEHKYVDSSDSWSDSEDSLAEAIKPSKNFDGPSEVLGMAQPPAVTA